MKLRDAPCMASYMWWGFLVVTATCVNKPWGSDYGLNWIRYKDEWFGGGIAEDSQHVPVR